MNANTPPTPNTSAGSHPTLDRRGALAAMGLGGAALASSAFAAPARAAILTQPQLGYDPATGRYTLPDLPYPAGALEPHIDAQTMRIHHGTHHAGYVRGLNKALDALDAIRSGSGDASLIKFWSRELSFHGSGHVNHTLFWLNMAPPGNGGGGRPAGKLSATIDRDFGSFDAFRAHFLAASGAVEASGWGWLVHDPIADRLLVLQGEKQQDLMMTGVTPLLGVDVWEHAYYLKYQSGRGKYLEAFMEVVNWSEVARRFNAATGA
ncbi:MAG: superoxide dismutase [Phycisphaerales bacterium JB037]